ncbi:peptidoglycan-binding protein [Kutzneria sp. CA-103260]|uniref:peptidoglycan-binding protein n=1 Tax=Kutzneria sp. CA-103260 TaxID=2802641 RepID=UPI001BAD7190|nr:peptidoglycan-binding protein [Kutzneria sp. CA-103260]QUQ67606.1 peptidoglycan-binding protein [Kutzneria sp. CA-103260]
MAADTRRRAVIGIAVLVVVVGAVLGVAVIDSRHGSAASVTATPPSAQTVAVKRMDLSNGQSFGGTLGFGAPQAVKGAGSGVVTKLPKIGDVAAQGKALYWVNDKPVPVFFGDTPLFRKLDGPTVKGADVAVVAQNLKALGYSVGILPKDPQETAFTPAVAAALKKWEKNAGLDDTGTLDVGQVLVLAGPMRVNSVTAQLGDPVAGDLLTVTSTQKVVTMPVDATEVGQIKTGAAVTIIRPDNKTVTAKVTAISTTVDGGDKQQNTGPPKLNVTVTPDDPSTLSDLDAASVQVQVTTSVHKGVLAVPVGALVALREGGYAVQTVDGKYHAVQTGMFANGMVEISGDGVAEGLKVVTTS